MECIELPRHWIMFLAACALLAGVALLVSRWPDPAHQSNVILITVDTLRADHLGLYGYGRNTSPHLDEFAKDAVVFRHAYSHAPVTVPSLSALMTSHYPHETRAVANYYVLPGEVVTLAEILQSQGYRTGAVVGNLAVMHDSGLHQGFDEYDDRLDDVDPLNVERRAEANTRAAIDWLQRHHRERFFLWVHYMDPHGPYTPPAPYDTMFVAPQSVPGRTLPVNKGLDGTGGIPDHVVLGEHRDPDYYVSQYDGEIRYCDQWLGELFQAVRSLGLLDRTLVVFTADHGEGLGEHNYYFDHTDYVYGELLHVPLIVRFPGQTGGRQVDRLVGQIELLPAILRGLSIEPQVSFEGSGALLEGKEPPIFAETSYKNGKRTVFTRDFKIIKNDEAYEAYDLKSDPGETHSQMDSNLPPPVLEQILVLKETLLARMSQDKLKLGAPTLRLMTQKLQDKLHALGYVQ